jgi:excisionase family DNA binding protein
MNVRVAPAPAELLTLAEAAAFLGCSVGHVRAMDRTGTLPIPTVKVGARTRIRRTELEAFLTGPAA